MRLLPDSRLECDNMPDSNVRHLLICFIFFCISCAHAPDPFQEIPIPQIIEAFHKKSEVVQSFSTNLFVEMSDSKNSIKGKGILVLQKPDSLRLEILSFFGNPLEVLASHDHKFQYYSSEYNEFYYGNASQSNLLHFFPIPFEIPELLELITGGITHTSTVASLQKHILSEEYIEIIIEKDLYLSEHIKIDRIKNAIHSISFYRDTDEVFELTFDNFQKVLPQVFLAKTVTFHEKKQNTTMKIQFENFDQLNQAFPKETFELPIPKNGKTSFFP